MLEIKYRYKYPISSRSQEVWAFVKWVRGHLVVVSARMWWRSRLSQVFRDGIENPRHRKDLEDYVPDL